MKLYHGLLALGIASVLSCSEEKGLEGAIAGESTEQAKFREEFDEKWFYTQQVDTYLGMIDVGERNGVPYCIIKNQIGPALGLNESDFSSFYFIDIGCEGPIEGFYELQYTPDGIYALTFSQALEREEIKDPRMMWINKQAIRARDGYLDRNIEVKKRIEDIRFGED